mmetsp:Transcript_8254/g.21922  ORF Transcript_8254/g.21922 Transcript_8254/m.21922 type:complete len:110 (-) Transcript_8254:3373-3702(-)
MYSDMVEFLWHGGSVTAVKVPMHQPSGTLPREKRREEKRAATMHLQIEQIFVPFVRSLFLYPPALVNAVGKSNKDRLTLVSKHLVRKVIQLLCVRTIPSWQGDSFHRED